MDLELNIDTEACQGYAEQIGQVIALYRTVQDWVLSENQKCAKVAAEAQYVTDLSDPSAYEKLMKANVAATRSTGLASVSCLLGTRCLYRLKGHFLEVVRRIDKTEQAICSRGEKLFDL